MTTSIKSRLRKDRWATWLVSIGGVGVIMAVALIFFYLLYEVVPMFRAARSHPVASYAQPVADAGETVHLAVEEQGEYGLRITQSGAVLFFATADGALVQQQQLPLPVGSFISSVGGVDPDASILALGLNTGGVLVIEYGYQVRFADGVRQMTPKLDYPFGEQVVQLIADQALVGVAIQAEDEETALVAIGANGDMVRVRYVVEESFLGLDEDEAEVETEIDSLGRYGGVVCRLLMDRMQRLMVVAGCDGQVSLYELNDPGVQFVQAQPVVDFSLQMTAIEFVSGTYSLLVGDSGGNVQQWFALRNAEKKLELQAIRRFKAMQGSAAIEQLIVEQRRKGFAVVAADGRFGLYSTTAQRQLLEKPLAGSLSLGAAHVAFAPRSNYLLFESGAVNGQPVEQQFFKIDNEYPEISWSALWQQVWYESYPEPDYIWQSSAATNDFEPKFSLTPLVFGTIKAAFYAMLFAVPISILGAIYTGYFMHSRMRVVVKPAIENLGALPTVIIGFLAGLWLAPILEANLPAFFTLLVVLPLGVLLVSFGYYKIPPRIKGRLPEGYEGLYLIPVLLVLGWVCFSVSSSMEIWLFGGDMRAWVSSELGLSFDQRNSIVVGIAMGIAVIPTIFSMTEDAIFSVPKHLTQGSLALGATPWQTLARVVILTASPGIFAAVMIGLGRAVGETMIVLMATGNTPIMDFNIFSGMRTLAANIAVEMPESEVGSTHYRVLFLAALVLFSLTFVFNTIAELVRQRLRERYGSL